MHIVVKRTGPALRRRTSARLLGSQSPCNRVDMGKKLLACYRLATMLRNVWCNSVFRDGCNFHALLACWKLLFAGHPSCESQRAHVLCENVLRNARPIFWDLACSSILLSHAISTPGSIVKLSLGPCVVRKLKPKGLCRVFFGLLASLTASSSCIENLLWCANYPTWPCRSRRDNFPPTLATNLGISHLFSCKVVQLEGVTSSHFPSGLMLVPTV